VPQAGALIGGNDERHVLDRAGAIDRRPPFIGSVAPHGSMYADTRIRTSAPFAAS